MQYKLVALWHLKDEYNFENIFKKGLFSSLGAPL